jgi:hypothetical protein
MAIRTHWAMRCLRLFGVEPAAYQPFASYAIRLGFKSTGHRMALLHRPCCDYLEGFHTPSRHCSASSWLHQPLDDLEGFRRWLLHLSSPCTQPFANRQLQFTNRIPGCLILDG